MPDIPPYLIVWIVVMVALRIVYNLQRDGGGLILRGCRAVSSWHE